MRISVLEIKLFGVLTAERDGQPLASLPSRKVRDLLAYLLIHRRTPRAREEMAALFWPELDGDKARHCLNTTLWRLRGALRPLETGPPYLRVDAQRIGFNMASDVRVDVEEFESRCALAEKLQPTAEAQQADLYHQAMDLYAGDLLTDCYDDWCLVERERLQLLYLRVLGKLLTYHARRREHDIAIDCGRRILARDPLREKVHRALIRLHLDAGQPTAALQQYRECEEIVRRELGTEVMPETRALLERITTPPGARQSPGPAILPRDAGSGAAAASPGLAAQLAAALTRLTDTANTLDRLASQLRDAAAIIEAVQQCLGAGSGFDRLQPRSLDGRSEPPVGILRPRLEELKLN